MPVSHSGFHSGLKWFQRHEYRCVALLLLLGWLLRLQFAADYWIWFDSLFPGLWEHSRLLLSPDANNYVLYAVQAASGNPGRWLEAPFFRPPGASAYFEFLLPLVNFDRLAVSLVQATLSLSAYLALYLTSRRFFPAIPALLGLLLLVCHPVLIFFDTSLEDYVPSLVPLAWGFWAFVRGLLCCNRRGFHWLMVASACFAMAILCRPNGLLVVFLLALWLCTRLKSDSWMLRFTASLVLLVLPLCAVAFMSNHNASYLGRHGVTVNTVGQNLAWGNYGFSDDRIRLAGMPEEFWLIPDSPMNTYLSAFESVQIRSGGEGRTSADLDQRLLHGTLSYMQEHPVDVLSGVVLKALRHLSVYEIPRNRDFAFTRQASGVLNLPYIPYNLLLGLALVYLIWKRQWILCLFLIPVVANWALESVFFNASRYRSSGIVFLAPLAAAALVEAASRWQVERRSLLLPMGFLVLLMVIGLVVCNEEFRNKYRATTLLKVARNAHTGFIPAPPGQFSGQAPEIYVARLKKALELYPQQVDAFYSLQMFQIYGLGQAQMAQEEIRKFRADCVPEDWLCQEISKKLLWIATHPGKYLKRIAPIVRRDYPVR